MDPCRRPRSYPFVVAPSRRRFYLVGVVSSHLLSRPVVARLVVSFVIRSVRRFHLLVAIRFVVVPPLVSSSSRFACRSVFRLVVVPLPALSSHPSSRPRRRLIRRRLTASCAVSACSSLVISFPRLVLRLVVVPPLVPSSFRSSSRFIPSARPRSPFLDTQGGAPPPPPGAGAEGRGVGKEG